MTRQLRPTAAVVDCVFGNHFIHVDIVALGRDFLEHLALKGERYQRSRGLGMLQEFVVVAFAMSCSAPISIKGNSRNHD